MIIVLGAGFSILSLRYFPVPYIWISLFFFLILVYAALTRIKPFVKLLCLNLGICILILGGLETYLWTSQALSDKERFEGDYSDYTRHYTVTDDILGYAPGKGKAFTSIKFLGEKELYNVTYTIDIKGLRAGPQYKNKETTGCILFFGDSFTFGEGLNDNETLPYIVGMKTRGKYTIYNFGFHGYGPHQMLSAVEHDVVDNIVECKPNYAIYQALVTHVDRAAGLSFWDQHGPRYILDADGSVKYRGHFDDDKTENTIKMKVRNQMEKSFIYKKYIDRVEPVSRAHIDLFIAIIDKTRRLLEERYPGLEFHIILWDKPVIHRELIIRRLKEKTVPVYLIEKVLPGYPKNRTSYAVNPPYENHPNALANERIADYIITHILKK